MSIANLTRYDIGGDSCDCGQSCSFGMEPSKDGDYVKFEEAMEASSNSLQQLKAEIAEVVRYLEDNHPSSEFGPNHIISHVLGKLRQLSAV